MRILCVGGLIAIALGSAEGLLRPPKLVVRTGKCRKRKSCPKVKRSCFKPEKLLAPALLPLVPAAGFFGLMTAPIYGKGLLPGAGGFVEFEDLTNRISTNEYLVAPPDECPKFRSKATGGGGGGPNRAEAPVYAGVSASKLQDLFTSVVEEQYTIKAYARPTLSRPEERHLVFVQRTPLLRFPDIINVKFLAVEADDGGTASTLIAHSGSVYGFDDLGKNRERLTTWVQRLDDAVASEERRLAQKRAASAKAGAEAAGPPMPPVTGAEAAVEPAAKAVAEAAEEVMGETVQAAADVVEAALDQISDAAEAVAEAVESAKDEVAGTEADAGSEAEVRQTTEAPPEDSSEANESAGTD